MSTIYSVIKLTKKCHRQQYNNNNSSSRGNDSYNSCAADSNDEIKNICRTLHYLVVHAGYLNKSSTNVS